MKTAYFETPKEEAETYEQENHEPLPYPHTTDPRTLKLIAEMEERDKKKTAK